MDLIADILLAAGALGAAVYCVVLSRRLARFTDLQGGMGGAVAALSSQVDEMTRALERARRAAGEQSGTLERSTRRAEEVVRRLELLVASMHDLPAEGGEAKRGEASRAEEGRAAPAAPVAAPVPQAAAPRPAPVAEPATPTPNAAPEAVRVSGAPAPASAPAWDDWDPFELAAAPEVPENATDLAGRAARMPAPERAIGGRAASAMAPEPVAPGLPMPIFSAARPGSRGAERREGPLTRRITAAE